MAFFFAFQAIGFTFDVHYCQGEAQSISFFGKADQCDRQNHKPDHSCCKSKMNGTSGEDGIRTRSNCCSNEMFHLQLDEEYEESAGFAEIFSIDDLLLNVHPCQKLIVCQRDLKPAPGYPDPPVLARNLNILYQVFRI